jgi:hypothetical protein
MVATRSRYRFLNVRSQIERLTALALCVCAGIAAIAGLGGAVAGTVALQSAHVLVLAASAVIAVAASMVIHAVGGLYRAKRRFRHLPDRLEVIAVFGGLGAELVGGAGAGVLALLALGGHIVPYTLLPTAAVAIGGGALVVAPAHDRLSWLAHAPVSRVQRAAARLVPWSAWALGLTGTASTFLGIVALLGIGPELVLAAVGMVGVGVAMFVAGGAMMGRYRAPLEHEAPGRMDAYAAALIELMQARLVASRTGLALYQAAARKLAGRVDADTVSKFETFAEKELENIDFLEYHLAGLGADPEARNVLASTESHVTEGIERVVISSESSSESSDPLSILSALHAADLHDESGWRLLTQVAEEIANEELKHEIKVKYGDKAEQGRYIARLLESFVQHELVREPLVAPLPA